MRLVHVRVDVCDADINLQSASRHTQYRKTSTCLVMPKAERARPGVNLNRATAGEFQVTVLRLRLEGGDEFINHLLVGCEWAPILHLFCESQK